MVLEQVRVTLMALGLALMMAPIVATIEPLVELFTKALPNFVPSAPCQGLLTDRRSADLVVPAALGFFMVQNGFQVASVDANPRAIRFLRQSLLVGAAALVFCPVWYASDVASPSHAIIYAALTAFVVTLAPYVSFAAWGLVTAERKSCKRAAQEIVFGMSIRMTTV